MTTTDGERNERLQRLGAAIEETRVRQGRTKSQLARLAGMTTKTWANAEQGVGIREDKLAAIEQALGWEAGTATSFLRGQVPEIEVTTVELPAAEDGLRTIVAAWGSLDDRDRHALEVLARGFLRDLDESRRNGD